MPSKSKLSSLLRLLDEPNQQAASLIMAELLEHENEVEEELARLQESDDPMIRRRVHQLESILHLRKRRRDFAEKLRGNRIAMLDGLVEIHLQWYDNDAPEMLFRQWEKLTGSAGENTAGNIENVAYFMRKAGFAVPPPNDLQADYYCLGIVLEELVGADAILCAIAQEVARQWGLDLQIIQLIENFALIDQDKRVLTPRDGWRVHAPMKKNHYNIWDASKVLKYAASMLFLCAVSTDSFRYVSTIGSCLSTVCGEENLDFLPYPYNRVPDKKD